MKHKIILLTILATSFAYAQTIPNERDNRGSFSPSVERRSPFEFTERAPERAPAPEVRGSLGVGDAIRMFITPSGYISGDTFADNKIFIGDRFYEVDDIMELSVVEGPEQFIYPVMELVIRDISDEYVEFFHTDTSTLQRLEFDFRPDIGSRAETTGNLGNGATLRFIGRDEDPLF